MRNAAAGCKRRREEGDAQREREELSRMLGTCYIPVHLHFIRFFRKQLGEAMEGETAFHWVSINTMA